MIHVVLFEPEIPQNTGNIIRTCAATQVVLHLIEPLGFSLDEKHLRRSGLDYHDFCEIQVHASFEDFQVKYPHRFFFITRYGLQPPSSFDFTLETEDVFLIFGKESTGIPLTILKDNIDRCMRLPMVASARSLNLSNAVAVVVYEVLRQLDYPFLSKAESIKGEDWLNQVK